jgi:hypothetical protein
MNLREEQAAMRARQQRVAKRENKTADGKKEPAKKNAAACEPSATASATISERLASWHESGISSTNRDLIGYASC